MSLIEFSNNAVTAVSGSISTSATSVNVANGAIFPALSAGQYFMMTHINGTSTLPDEIVKVTAIAGDTLTIVRGQEGTSAVIWNSGDTVASFLTAGVMSALAQDQQVQQNVFNFGVDTGAVNAYIVTLSPAPTLATGMYVEFTTANSNTTTNPTLTVNGTTINITMPGGGSLTAGQIPANAVISLAYNATGPRLELQGIPIPVSIKTGMIASWLGSSVPAGVLQWGVSTINVSRATYANLFAAIGTTYGVGDGSTTFGLPAMPNNYALINVGSGTLGTLSVGAVMAHTHTYGYPNTPSGNGGSGNPDCTIPGLSGAGTTGSTGGSINAAAGLSVNFGFYF